MFYFLAAGISIKFKEVSQAMFYFLAAGISLAMRAANERRRYIVTVSLIGWAHR